MNPTLIPFKVVIMALHTLLPTALPLFKALLKGFFRDGLQSGRRVHHYVFSRFKPLAFQRRLELGKQPKITGIHIG